MRDVIDLEDQALLRRRQILDRALSDDPPPVDDSHCIARPLDLIEQVRGDEHRPAVGLDELPDHDPELPDARRVKPVARLVQD